MQDVGAPSRQGGDVRQAHARQAPPADTAAVEIGGQQQQARRVQSATGMGETTSGHQRVPGEDGAKKEALAPLEIDGPAERAQGRAYGVGTAELGERKKARVGGGDGDREQRDPTAFGQARNDRIPGEQKGSAGRDRKPPGRQQAESEQAIQKGLRERVERRNPVGMTVDPFQPRALAFQNGRAQIVLVNQGESRAGKPSLIGPSVFGKRRQARQHEVGGEYGEKEMYRRAPLGRTKHYLLRLRRQAAKPKPANPTAIRAILPGSGVTTESATTVGPKCAKAARPNKNKEIVMIPHFGHLLSA